MAGNSEKGVEKKRREIAIAGHEVLEEDASRADGEKRMMPNVVLEQQMLNCANVGAEWQEVYGASGCTKQSLSRELRVHTLWCWYAGYFVFEDVMQAASRLQSWAHCKAIVTRRSVSSNVASAVERKTVNDSHGIGRSMRRCLVITQTTLLRR